jgi:hypothetical protein
MYDGFVSGPRRWAAAVRPAHHLHGGVHPRGHPLREAEFFAEQLTARKLHLGAIVLNKVLPDYLRAPSDVVKMAVAGSEAGRPAAVGAPR